MQKTVEVPQCVLIDKGSTFPSSRSDKFQHFRGQWEVLQIQTRDDLEAVLKASLAQFAPFFGPACSRFFEPSMTHSCELSSGIGKQQGSSCS